jgi:type IV pilus assembly protein PilN
MKIGINLASRPYQDAGRFYRIWGGALTMTVLFTALMVFLSIHHYRESQQEWVSAREAQAKLAVLRKEETEAQQILARPENRGTRDQSQFLNSAILRKSFSWTRLMEDMEKVMPSGLRVVSIAPIVDQRNRFTLKISVEGETRDSAVQLLRNMEKSQHFRSPQVISENHTTTGQPGVRSEITSSYLPHEALEGGD